MDCIIEAISHRRFAKSGKKRLILGRSTSVHLPRLRRFFLGFCETLDCDRFSDSFLLIHEVSQKTSPVHSRNPVLSERRIVLPRSISFVLLKSVLRKMF